MFSILIFAEGNCVESELSNDLEKAKEKLRSEGWVEKESHWVHSSFAYLHANIIPIGISSFLSLFQQIPNERLTSLQWKAQFAIRDFY